MLQSTGSRTAQSLTSCRHGYYSTYLGMVTVDSKWIHVELGTVNAVEMLAIIVVIIVAVQFTIKCF